MPARWTIQEETKKRMELTDLYIAQNKTISEVAQILDIKANSVYDRMIRLGIPPLRSQKLRYNNQRLDIVIPDSYSSSLAEFIGILLGDGGLTKTQITVTLDGREQQYIQYIVHLIQKIFHVKPKVISRKDDTAKCIYFGSTSVIRYLLKMGLVYNKVKEQVSIPEWILHNPEYKKACIRGLIDTDGSVYKLRFGVQISFTSRSIPLLSGVRQVLLDFGYRTSRISGFAIYLTKQDDLLKYYRDISFSNPKHKVRFLRFMKSRGTEVDKPGRL